MTGVGGGKTQGAVWGNGRWGKRAGNREGGGRKKGWRAREDGGMKASCAFVCLGFSYPWGFLFSLIIYL